MDDWWALELNSFSYLLYYWTAVPCQLIGSGLHVCVVVDELKRDKMRPLEYSPDLVVYAGYYEYYDFYLVSSAVVEILVHHHHLQYQMMMSLLKMRIDLSVNLNLVALNYTHPRDYYFHLNLSLIPFVLQIQREKNTLIKT
jgi:hypothetical protein